MTKQNISHTGDGITQTLNDMNKEAVALKWHEQCGSRKQPILYSREISLALCASWIQTTGYLVFRYFPVSSERAEICREPTRVMVLRIDGYRCHDLYLTWSKPQRAAAGGWPAERTLDSHLCAITSSTTVCQVFFHNVCMRDHIDLILWRAISCD